VINHRRVTTLVRRSLVFGSLKPFLSGAAGAWFVRPGGAGAEEAGGRCGLCACVANRPRGTTWYIER
jgi:hypothetical protein